MQDLMKITLRQQWRAQSLLLTLFYFNVANSAAFQCVDAVLESVH
jgi:hypothetical protein